METTPPLPSSKPPLGGFFYFALILPLILMGITAAIVDLGNTFIPVLGLTGLITLASSAYLAMQLSRRFSKDGEGSLVLTLIMFFALQGFYGGCFFVGCTALSMLG